MYWREVVTDFFEMLVTVLIILVTNITIFLHQRRTPPFKRCHHHRKSVTSINKSSSTLSHCRQHKCLQQHCYLTLKLFDCQMLLTNFQIWLNLFQTQIRKLVINLFELIKCVSNHLNSIQKMYLRNNFTFSNTHFSF